MGLDHSKERLTDAARAWIIDNPSYNHIDRSADLQRLIQAGLGKALEEGVNYIDVTHLRAAESDRSAWT